MSPRRPTLARCNVQRLRNHTNRPRTTFPQGTKAQTHTRRKGKQTCANKKEEDTWQKRPATDTHECRRQRNKQTTPRFQKKKRERSTASTCVHAYVHMHDNRETPQLYIVHPELDLHHHTQGTTKRVRTYVRTYIRTYIWRKNARGPQHVLPKR